MVKIPSKLRKRSSYITVILTSIRKRLVEALLASFISIRTKSQAQRWPLK